jgi:hypothetical protein
VFQPRDWRLQHEFMRKSSQLLYDADVSFDFRPRSTCVSIISSMSSTGCP